MKKFISLFLIFLTSLSLGANNPTTPPLGGTGVSNPLANTITVNAPMIFPDNINLQLAYEQSVGYPHSKITFPSGGELVFTNALNYTVADIGEQFGIYSEVGFSGSFEVGNFGIGINTVDAASTFFSVSPVDNSVGFGTLPYPDFNSAAEGTINLTNAPKGLILYNIDTNTQDVYDGTAFRKIISTNHILANNNATATDNGNGTVTIGTSGLALDSAVVHNTGNETIAGAKTFTSVISGDIGGVATKANTLSTTQNSSNANFYLSFFPATTNSYQAISLNTSLTVNPSTNTIGANISGNAATATNGVVTTGSYADPTWVTSLNANKLTGTIPTAVLANIPKITVTSYLSATTTTYTVPAGVTHICVQGWGSGAGGGGVAGVAGQTAAASGGGSGAYFYKCISSPLTSYAVVVAAGGPGGVAGANNGSVGATTTFGTAFLTAPGGNNGLGATASITATILQGGGTQGVATGGDINTVGNPGGIGITVGSSSSQLKGGDGAQAIGGNAARGPMNSAGATASFCGGGGSGAASTTAASSAGGAGKDGCIIIYEYYAG